MAQLVVRNLEQAVKVRLRRRARLHRRSMEEEAREILRNAVQKDEGASRGLGSEIAALFAGIGLDADIAELRGHRIDPAVFDRVIVLDTNVLSGLMRQTPDPEVVAWLDEQPRASVWTTSVSVLEVRFGLQILPAGKRRSALMQAFDALLVEKIEQRIAPFDVAAAEQAGDLMALRHRKGRPGDLRDTLQAGIVLAHHATLATRNTRHFEDLSVPVVNPWHRAR